jgi:hypothetical protein
MSELMVLLQALLLIAGWLLFLRAQTELRAQAARQSLTGELEELRQTLDALLQKLAEDAARAEARLEARLRELERYAARELETEPTPTSNETRTPPTPSARPETLTPDSGYNLSGSATSPSWRSADAGGARANASRKSRAKRATQLGEVELIS